MAMMKRALGLLIAVLVVVGLMPVGALASEQTAAPKVETNAPVINSVTVDKNQVAVGETLTVTMDVTDESELAEVSVTFDEPLAGNDNYFTVRLTKGEDGLYRGVVATDETMPCGTYTMLWCVAEDVLGNKTHISGDASLNFELTSEQTDVYGPEIHSVTLDKTQVVAGETVTVTMDVTDKSELAKVSVTFDKPLAGDNNYLTVHLTKGEDGLYRGVVATDETMPCGTYTMLWCVAEDVLGNKTQTGRDSSLNFEMSGGNTDVYGPEIRSVTVDKNRVLVGETVTVTMDVTDESELAEVSVTFDEPLAGNDNYFTVRLTKGEDGLYRGVVATDETMPCGTYTMLWCVAEDVPGNKTQTRKDAALNFELNTVFFTKQPESVETPIGGKVKVSVAARGEGLRYQWYYSDNGGKSFGVSAIKKATYAITMAEYAHGRQLYCVVTDKYGNQDVSETITLTRPPKAAAILQQPKDVYVEKGNMTQVTFKAEGDGLTYQWYYKEDYMKTFKVSSIRSKSYNIRMAEYMDGRTVYCVITDMFGNQVQTDPVTIWRVPPTELKVLEQDGDVYGTVGKKFSISFDIQGDGLTYQWYVKENGAKAFKLSSNKSAAYAYTLQKYMNGRSVYCVITDRYGNTVQTNPVTIHIEK